MARLIDADALVKRVSYMNMEAYMDGVRYGIHPSLEYLDLLSEIIEDAPTVDAVPVVRCAECKLHDNCYTEDVFKFAGLNDDRRFCGVGERK